jgi:hypothetical protein
MSTVWSRRLAGFVIVCVAALALARPASGQTAAPDTGTIRGIVLDRADGSPIADVSVRLPDEGAAVKTDAEGRFELAGVRPGRRVVYVSLVGFILVKRTVELAPGATLDLTVALTEGTGTYSETVTVAGERFREQEKSVPAQQTLGSADIQNLRNLLTNDPMRAIQVLPGVTTGDDFRSEFAVRGSPFGRMNFTFDSIPTTFLLHTVQQVRDGGSIAMLNGDVLDGITLLNGSYPQRYGNRLGAELDFHMREGSRERTQTRVGVSGTDASVVVEGPLGRAKAGSWLFSARKSYLEYLLKQVTDEDDDLTFGFSDLQSKAVYDVSPRQRVEVSIVAGRSRLEQTSGPKEVNTVDDGRNRAALVNAAWRFTASPRLVVTERLAFGSQHYTNRNPLGSDLGRGSAREITWRTDIIASGPASLTFESGGQIQAQHREDIEQGVRSAGFPPEVVTSYDANGRLSSAYGHVRWTGGSRFAAAAGARVDHWSLTGGAGGSPWMQAELRLRGTLKLRGGSGLYRQFPGIREVAGPFGSRDLRPERAYHADAGIEQALGPSARWQVTFYNREERGVLRLPGEELRVLEGSLAGYPTAPWTNALDGYARGAELLVQRRSNSGLSGWLSYSYGLNRYRDRFTGETFDGDYDQRHTFNAYGLYRVTNRFSLTGKWRIGSNTPAVGYWEEHSGAFFLGSARNTLRVPVYSRLDIRANRTFNWENKRMTLFVEVLNALGRDNVRFEQPGVNVNTLQAFGLFSSMIPRVPSAGILIEF